MAIDDELAAIVLGAVGGVSDRDRARLRALLAHAEATEARDDASQAAREANGP